MKEITVAYSKVFTLLFSLAACIVCQAQWYNPDKVNSKAAEVYAKAYEAAQEERYGEAMVNIAKAIELDPKFVDAYLSRAGIFANMKKYDSS